MQKQNTKFGSIELFQVDFLLYKVLNKVAPCLFGETTEEELQTIITTFDETLTEFSLKKNRNHGPKKFTRS